MLAAFPRNIYCVIAVVKAVALVQADRADAAERIVKSIAALSADRVVVNEPTSGTCAGHAANAAAATKSVPMALTWTIGRMPMHCGACTDRLAGWMPI